MHHRTTRPPYLPPISLIVPIIVPQLIDQSVLIIHIIPSISPCVSVSVVVAAVCARPWSGRDGGVGSSLAAGEDGGYGVEKYLEDILQ